MSGYEASAELTGVAAKVHGEADSIADEVAALGRSRVTAAAGGREFADKVTAYLNALRDNVIAGVIAYRSETTAVGDKLLETYHRYAGGEDDAHGAAKGAGR